MGCLKSIKSPTRQSNKEEAEPDAEVVLGVWAFISGRLVYQKTSPSSLQRRGVSSVNSSELFRVPLFFFCEKLGNDTHLLSYNGTPFLGSTAKTDEDAALRWGLFPRCDFLLLPQPELQRVPKFYPLVAVPSPAGSGGGQSPVSRGAPAAGEPSMSKI